MKTFTKVILIVAAGMAVLAGCAKKSEISNLQDQIDALKSDQIQTITGQISAISGSLTNLQSADTQLKAYIETLQGQASNLESSSKNLEDAITKLKEDLKNEIGAAESEALKQLETLKASIDAELKTLNTTINGLQDKDKNLQNQIDELKKYIEEELKNAKDWATATFATLEQYNKTAEIVAGIQGQIETINCELAEVKKHTDDVKSEIDKAIASLRTDLQAEIKAAADAAAQALTTATEEITKAYTAAIEAAIKASESSIKTWVNEQLAGYYTAAQIDSKLQALQTALENKLNSQNESLKSLISTLETTLNTKISDNKKLIDNLTTELAGVKPDISTLGTKVTKNSEDIATNSGKISENAKAISDNATAIADAKKLISDNTTLIENNKTAIKANADAISDLQTKVGNAEKTILQHTADISKNAQNIATNAANIATNAADILTNKTNIATNTQAIADLKKALADQKNEIEEAYKKAISDAITANNGTIDQKITDAIKPVTDSLTALRTRLSDLQTKVKALTDRVAAIEEGLKSLTSIAYIPKYSDGKERVGYELNGSDYTGQDLTLRFDVYPESSAKAIAGAYSTAISAKAIYTRTKASAGDFADFKVTGATANGGILTVTVSTEKLDKDFFLGNLEAAVVLKITTGYNNLESDYIGLTPTHYNVESVTLDQSDLTVYTKDAPVQLNATVLPDKAYNKQIVWTSSDTAVATVDKNGNVTAKKAGQTTITAASEDDPSITATCKVTVKNKSLTFSAASTQGFKMVLPSNADAAAKLAGCFEYSTDNGATWTTVPANMDYVTFGNGTDLLLRGKSQYGTAYDTASKKKSSNIAFSDASVPVSCSGDIRTLIDWENFSTVSTTDARFAYLFCDPETTGYGTGHAALSSAPELPSTDLATRCYQNMFIDCTALETAPVLPAIALAKYCYYGMFCGTSLKTAPALPAKTLAEYCYRNMFTDCTALESAPVLPATALANYCYYEMFSGCTSLESAPVLPATALANYCYYEMFSGCTSLESAPALPAETLAYACYQNMFNGCTALKTAPALPAKALDKWCYSGMFSGCTSLETAPALPAKTLANYCYLNMFSDCTALEAAPALPAATLSELCYQGMFEGCTALKTAPTLPAETLSKLCYVRMFKNCSNLEEVTVKAKTTADSAFSSWLEGVAASGKIHKRSTLSLTADSIDGIPSGWTAVDDVTD